MADKEMAEWFAHYFPAIAQSAPQPRGPRGCWLSRMRDKTAEHNPPFYWLARALDAIAEAGEEEAYGRRLVAAHGPDPCEGDGADERAHAVLSEACAFAWTVAHLGPARFEAAVEGATLERGALRLHVPAHDAFVAPARLGRQRSVEALVDAVTEHAREAAAMLPHASGRILYLDTGFEHSYAENVGYRLDLTEPVQEALRRRSAELHLGHVLTRPFQWGNPVEASY